MFNRGAINQPQLFLKKMLGITTFDRPPFQKLYPDLRIQGSSVIHFLGLLFGSKGPMPAYYVENDRHLRLSLHSDSVVALCS